MPTLRVEDRGLLVLPSFDTLSYSCGSAIESHFHLPAYTWGSAVECHCNFPRLDLNIRLL
jgi:hypothetical protein